MSSTFHDHFSAVAARYADFRPHYPQALFDYLATLRSKTSTVWDCAAGNGQATLDLAKRFARVVATDASPQQIASATPHPRIEYRVAPAENSGLKDGSIDLVTVAQALHWFDLKKFYAETNRVLATDGVIAVWAYGINQVEGNKVNECALNYYHNVVGPYWPPERVLVEEGYRTLEFPFAEITPPSFQMEAQWTLDQLLGYLSTWSATNRFIKTHGRNPLEQLESELAKLWGDRNAARLITWPLSLRVGQRVN